MLPYVFLYLAFGVSGDLVKGLAEQSFDLCLRYGGNSQLGQCRLGGNLCCFLEGFKLCSLCAQFLVGFGNTLEGHKSLDAKGCQGTSWATIT